MRITVLAVGGRMPAWVDEGVAEYSKRLPRELRLEWRDIPLAQRGKKNTDIDAHRDKEGQALLKAIPDGDRVLALDVRGEAWSTEQLAVRLRNWHMESVNTSLLVGGPDGLSEACLQRADTRWSLSALTLPHPLVRVLLAEQIYRAWTITVNHPYHRA